MAGIWVLFRRRVNVPFRRAVDLRHRIVFTPPVTLALRRLVVVDLLFQRLLDGFRFGVNFLGFLQPEPQPDHRILPNAGPFYQRGDFVTYSKVMGI
jgi:hypothetical protein